MWTYIDVIGAAEYEARRDVIACLATSSHLASQHGAARGRGPLVPRLLREARSFWAAIRTHAITPNRLQNR